MLKVASYNMRKGIGTDRVRRPDRICDVLCEIGADVVALQEADRRFGARAAAIPVEMIARCTPYTHVDFARRPDSIGWHGNAILVPRESRIDARGHIDIPTIEPRGAVWADLELGGGPIRIVAMHLDLSGLRRRQQARAIAEALGRLPVRPTVLMGDLNEWTLHGGAVSEFAHHYRMAPTGPSFHARRPVARLDRIMVSPALTIEACGVHHSLKSRHASDHLPIWARIVQA
ncbi:MAG: endonuclease/exonuclease/phosphatase family protein [Sphingomonadaceae bacterium]|nr:endonuclease/exonuclease/phosphatase family protein [Sphingomonadaceae bacterium]